MDYSTACRKISKIKKARTRMTFKGDLATGNKRTLNKMNSLNVHFLMPGDLDLESNYSTRLFLLLT